MADSNASTHAEDGLAILKALSTVIQDSINKIETTLAAEKLQFPSPSTTFTMESEVPRNLPPVAEAISYIIAAADQLIAVTRAPTMTGALMSQQYLISAALGIAVRANVPEICRDAGPKGAHVKDIAASSGVDASKLSRVLRLLATKHIFVEVSPDVFANNRASSVLDSGKSLKDLLASPDTKHIDTLGIAAGVGYFTDESLKAGAYLEDAIFDPKLSTSGEPNETPFNLAFKTDLTFWNWYDQKENAHRLLRFNIAMEGGRKVEPPGLILQGFDWAGLPKDSLVVDVGGGVGAHCVALVKTHPHLRFLVQDRQSVLKDGLQFWETQAPETLESGRIRFEEHDFFSQQPIKGAAVFMMRMIMHDWSDKFCIKILQQLREAAAPSTQLLLIDNVVPYACAEEESTSIPGVQRRTPPYPLLANLGEANSFSYILDVQMWNLFNAQERTIVQIRDMLAQAGWKLVRVAQRGPFEFHVQKMIAIPA